MGRLWLVLSFVVLAIAIGVGALWYSLSQPVTVAGIPASSVQPQASPMVPASAPASSQAGTPQPGQTGSIPPAQPPGQSGTNPVQPTAPATSNAPDKALSYSNIAIGPTSKSGIMHAYVVAVEKGAGLKANTVAQAIAKTMNDPRSWAGSGHVRFDLVKDASKAEITIAIMTTATSVSRCGGAAVCWSSGTVVIDAARWTAPPTSYAGDALGFQRYLVNHGVGFALGNKTFPCLKQGSNANVMQAQDGDLGGCKANPWVYP